MKKIKGLKGLIVGIAIMSFMLAGSAFATDRLSLINKELSNIDEEEVLANLSAKSFDELINDINVLGDNVDMSDLIFHASALVEKAGEIPQEKIIKEIMDDTNTNNVRVILIQINRFLDNSESSEELLALLEQKDVDFEIKRNVLLNVYKDSPKDVAVYEKIAYGEDDRLAFQAIKILDNVAPEKADAISDSIIQNYDGIVTDKVRAAIKVKASHLGKSSAISERQDFIRFCDSILLTGKTDDLVADTVIFALSDVMSEETISYIVTSDKIDNTAKTYCIDQNYIVLRSMLTQNVTNEKISVVIEAMSIHPISNMVEPLQTTLSSQLRQRSAESTKMSRELQDIINWIDENGINATNKY